MCADILTVTIIVWEEVFKCKAARELLLFPFNTKLAPVTVGNNLGIIKERFFISSIIGFGCHGYPWI